MLAVRSTSMWVFVHRCTLWKESQVAPTWNGFKILPLLYTVAMASASAVANDRACLRLRGPPCVVMMATTTPWSRPPF